jgi:hypothetical protein
MSPRILLVVVGVGLAAALLWASATAESPKAFPAPVPKIKPEKKTVPLDAIFSVPKLEGSTSLRDKIPEFHKQDLLDILSAAKPIGFSTAFLVRGENLKEAIRGTYRAFNLSWDVDEIVPGSKQTDEGEKDGDVWVCAFLGSKPSAPRVFEVDRVEVEGKSVRVMFKRPLGGLSNDCVPYLVWANLGRLSAGTYQVELIDATPKQPSVVTSRKVFVSEVKQ